MQFRRLGSSELEVSAVKNVATAIVGAWRPAQVPEKAAADVELSPEIAAELGPIFPRA